MSPTECNNELYCVFKGGGGVILKYKPQNFRSQSVFLSLTLHRSVGAAAVGQPLSLSSQNVLGRPALLHAAVADDQ